MPAQIGKFKLRISVNLCKNFDDTFLDTKGSHATMSTQDEAHHAPMPAKSHGRQAAAQAASSNICSVNYTHLHAQTVPYTRKLASGGCRLRPATNV